MRLLDQVAERRLSDDRVHNVLDRTLGVVQGGFGETEEQVVLAVDLLHVVEDLPDDLSLRACSDLVGELQQKIDHVVGQFSASRPAEAGEERVPDPRGLVPELGRSHHRHSNPEGLDHIERDLHEQIGG